MSNEKKKLMRELIEPAERGEVTTAVGLMANWILKLMERTKELERQVGDLRSGVESNEARLDHLDADDHLAKITIAEVDYLKDMFKS